MRRSRMLLVIGVGLALIAAVVVVMRSGDDAPEGAAAAPLPGPSDPPAPVPDDPKRERWRWDGAVVTNVAAAGHGVVAVTDKLGYVGIDGSTGRKLWERRGREKIVGDVPSLEAVPGGRTVITWIGPRFIGRGLAAFDAFTGRPLWQADRAAAGVATGFDGIAVTESTVVLGEAAVTVGAPPALRALAVDTGKEVWRYPAPAGCEIRGGNDSSLAAGDATVFVELDCDASDRVDGDYAVVALDAASGAELWRRQIGGVPLAIPAQPIGGGAVALWGVARSTNRTVWITTAVDQRTGQDLGPAGPEIGRVAAAVPDSLDVVTGEGLHRVGDPAPRWQFPEDGPSYQWAPVQFGQLVARFAYGCGKKTGVALVLYELGTGERRRSLGCFGYPGQLDPVAVSVAPGALVVRSDGELIGYA